MPLFSRISRGVHRDQPRLRCGDRLLLPGHVAASKALFSWPKKRFFHGDTMTCLTQWTSASDLSEACTKALPKKADEDDEAVPQVV